MSNVVSEGIAGVIASPEGALGEVRAGVLRLHKKTDDFFSAVHARHLPRMQCGPGCASCCGRMPTVFPVEAWIMAELLREGPESAMRRALDVARRHEHDDDLKPCPMLNSREYCRIYSMRPIICRSHGAPIRVPGRSIRSFDACPLNFPEPGQRQMVSQEDILDIERLNEILAVVDNLFRQAHPESESLPLRMPLARGLVYFFDADD